MKAADSGLADVKVEAADSVLADVKEEAADSVLADVKEEPLCQCICSGITVSEEKVVNLWRMIGIAKGFLTDTDLAKFLMSLYIHGDQSPEKGGSGDVTAGRLQTDRPSWQQGSTQTDAQCNKCSRPLALVCINSQCQRSPLGPVVESPLSQTASGKVQTSKLSSKKVPPSSLHPERRSSGQTRSSGATVSKSLPSTAPSSRALPPDVCPVTEPSSGDEMEVEELSLTLEAKTVSSGEDSDVDTVMSEGCSVQTEPPSGISQNTSIKTVQTSAYPVVNSRQVSVKLSKCDFQKDADLTSANLSSFELTKVKVRQLTSDLSAECWVEPIQQQLLQEVCDGVESRNRTTTYRSAENTKEKTDPSDTEQKLPEVSSVVESRKGTTTNRSAENTKEKTDQTDTEQKPQKVSSVVESRKGTTTNRSAENTKEKTDQTDTEQKPQKVSSEVESRKGTTTNRSAETTKEKTDQTDSEQKLPEVSSVVESRKGTTTNRSAETTKEKTDQTDSEQKLPEVSSVVESRKGTTTNRSAEEAKNTDQTDTGTPPADSVGSPDMERRCMPPARDVWDIPKYAAQTSADRREKTDTSDSSAKRPRGRPRKVESNFFVESGAEPTQRLEEKSNGTESRKRTTADRSAEDTKENTVDQTDTGTPPVESVGSPPDTKRRCMPPARDDPAKTPTLPRASSARHGTRTRSSGRLEQPEQPAEQPVTTATGKYPIVDGIAHKNGKLPAACHKYFEFRCSRCDNAFPSRLSINCHIRNPSCDDGKDASFKVTPFTQPSSTNRQHKSGETSEIEILNRFQDYESVKGVTLQEFMTGRIQVPINCLNIPGLQKEDERNWDPSHFTCLKCCTVFEIERELFLEHAEECNGIRDRDGVASGSRRHTVEDEPVAFEDRQNIEVEDADMTTADTQNLKDADMTNADTQNLKDADMTNADSQSLNDADLAIADSQNLKDADMAIADSQNLKDADLAIADSQNLKDADLAIADSQSLKDADLAIADSQNLKDADMTNADSQNLKDADLAITDSQNTKDLAKARTDGQISQVQPKGTASGQLTISLAKTTAGGQLTETRADQASTDDPSLQASGEDWQLDAKSVEILTRIKERYLFCCPHCDIVHFSREHQEMHTMSHFYTRGTRTKAFTCKLCSKSFGRYVDFHNHWIFLDQKHSQCVTCCMSYASRCEREPHRRYHQEASSRRIAQAKAQAKLTGKPLRRMKEKVPLLCSTCGKVFLDKSTLQAHMKSHSDEKPYTCSVCGLAMKKRSVFREHEAAHDGRHFQCEVCGQEFFRNRSLVMHIKNKHGGLVFRCELCDKELSGRTHLLAHVKMVHLKDRSHTCSVCGVRISGGKNSLKQHMRIHTGEKPYQCDKCPSRFARQDYLKKHARLHTGERPYKCNDCAQSFVCASSLKLHRRNRHSDKTLPCGDCDKVFLTSGSLDYHKYISHGGANKLFTNTPKRKIFPCGVCGKVLATANGLDFHLRKHQENNQKRPEHQDNDQNS